MSHNNSLQTDPDWQAVLSAMQRYCAYQERCTDDVWKRLSKEKWVSEKKEQLIQVLREEGFVNDERFAMQYVRSKINQNKWGKMKIRYALQQKRIQSSLIDEVLNAFPDEVYQQMVKDELQKKLAQLQAEPKEKQFQKLYRFAASRSYEPDIFMPLIILLQQTQIDL